jgi:hypothetical protein
MEKWVKFDLAHRRNSDGDIDATATLRYLPQTEERVIVFETFDSNLNLAVFNLDGSVKCSAMSPYTSAIGLEWLKETCGKWFDQED